MPDTLIDPKRTCKAIQAKPDDPDIQYGHFAIGVEFGKARGGDRVLMFACPGCGKTGSIPAAPSPKEPHAWEIVAGSLDDVTTLSLSPSIHCVGCCGWHGYLTAGEFRSC